MTCWCQAVGYLLTCYRGHRLHIDVGGDQGYSRQERKAETQKLQRTAGSGVSTLSMLDTEVDGHPSSPVSLRTCLGSLGMAEVRPERCLGGQRYLPPSLTTESNSQVPYEKRKQQPKLVF